VALLQDPLPLETGERSLATRQWELIEWAGCIWATILVANIGLVTIVFAKALPVFIPQFAKLRDTGAAVIRWGLVALWVLLDLPFVWRLWSSRSKRGNHEISLYVAALQPLLHPILRPLLALWWLGHFWLAIRLGMYSESITPMDPMVAPHFFLLTIFLCAFASNVFLIHAVTALTRGPAVQRVWNWRGAIDLGVVAVGLAWKFKSER
jgi:hypothetical protein